MRPEQRVVVKIPVPVLWDAKGELCLTRTAAVGRDRLTEHLRLGPVRFVVANCGDPLNWIHAADRFHFWKPEVRPRLVEPEEAMEGFRLEDYPGEYCYLGSVWSGPDEPVTVLLERYH